ncbi:MAG: hypothetical protein KatS3mg115_0443 [Candidatus Poribacteria bacterium]|nr:MAG: hypothetical protein KatS3mg115_0443 [Candidatus Poribacteria bacterium]
MFDLVAHDKAGERILLQCAQRRSEELGKRVRLYKNNTDYRGHSYGCHDNYLMRRDVPFEYVKQALIPFNVTRQLFAGAGKVGIETEEGLVEPGRFQISQRADFFAVEASVDTMHRRPLVNTRDEPHADPSRYRRLHGIVGDANMSEYATALKIGTTALVLECIEKGVVPESWQLKDPVGAIRAVSHDPTLRTTLAWADGKEIAPLEVQRGYLALAQRHCDRSDPDVEWVLGEWELTLDLLARDPYALVGKVDWITKKWLLEMFVEEEGVPWEDPWLRSLDLQYHDIDLEESLFYALQQEGHVTRLIDEKAVQQAVQSPPPDTRAYLRGEIVRRFGDRLASAQWDALTFAVDGRRMRFSLEDLVEPDEVRPWIALLKTAPNVEQFLAEAERY